MTVALVTRKGWPADRLTGKRVVLITTIIGGGYAVFSEWLNVEVRESWTYTEMMPRLPFLAPDWRRCRSGYCCLVSRSCSG